jgi:hypothetical protein
LGLSLEIAFFDSHQHAKVSHAFVLLRVCRKRPRSPRTTKQSNELAPLHCRPPTLKTGVIRSGSN